jgi:hypothetical protein
VLAVQVRIAAAQQLPALARVLGAAAAVSQVLPELKELLEDDEVQVRRRNMQPALVVVCNSYIFNNAPQAREVLWLCKHMPHCARDV